MTSNIKRTYTLLFVLAITGSVMLSAKQNNSTPQISDVQIKNNWIIVFSSNAKEISRMPQAKNLVVGITGSFFVVTANSWIITYNEKCKEIARMPSSKKLVKGAVGDSFTILSDNWIVTYDKKCKEKSRRPK